MPNALDALLTELITVTRPGTAGAYLNGRFVPDPSDTTLTFKCSWQPVADGEELRNNPENEYTEEQVDVFLKNELFTAETSPLKRPDLVSYNGKNYEVVAVERWAGLLPHFKARVEKLPEPGEGT